MGTSQRVVTLTPNPAVDVTYRVDALVPGATHRVTAVTERAGGKGVNVARVLTALGHPGEAVLPVGGPAGAWLSADLAAAGVPATGVPIAGVTRRSIAVVAGGGVTVLNEPGPSLADDEWSDVLGAVAAALTDAAVLVVSGSLPPGAPDDLYTRLSGIAASAGVATIMDTSGPALVAAACAGAGLLKPNTEELSAATGEDDPWRGAAMLRRMGARRVVISQGPDGLLAVDEDGTGWHVTVPPIEGGNPTGAGDAVVAALARAEALASTGHDHRPGPGEHSSQWWQRAVTEAAAWGASAVTTPTAGDVDPAEYRKILTETTVERVDAVGTPD